MKYLAAVATVFAFLGVIAANPADLQARQRDTCTKMTQRDAARKLVANGVYASSTGNCTTKSISTCTSYDGICEHTVDGVIAFKNSVGRDLVITGATETGHSPNGVYNHGNGYKVDLRPIPEIEAYVKKWFTAGADRGTDKRWYSPSGNEFVYEKRDRGAHWDITFFP
ncbi:hypothetical protein CC1G_12242 [Coprinopsis cinerea okayama7|uniref:Uncharacterized protein n=1 Tax=Coprinopsis cinerea (strain Okayama-7 / 130 / ATCC MYA-4618 / FGSC 9003) TaxID=240176 RepID=A8P1X2_COPC7|nr:hypothetical protein CC1G_12242 [Coprinopsis cinerea okayama7\|eukprot:XP_001838193.1 hypothetical protein CC1G_12242 [Coprinopsis cinerea okayama7\